MLKLNSFSKSYYSQPHRGVKSKHKLMTMSREERLSGRAENVQGAEEIFLHDPTADPSQILRNGGA